MGLSWFLFFYSFRNEMRMEKTFAFLQVYWAYLFQFVEDGALAHCALFTVRSLCWARLGLAKINPDLNLTENSQILTDNLQKHGENNISKQGWNKSYIRFETTSLKNTSSLSTSWCQSVCRRRWMPNMVILNIRYFSSQWIIFYNYCPDIYGQDGIGHRWR